ncbi:MAG: PAS domain-containing protein [Candidatus Heimdallarchaeota archaeon]|nr:MAG: PAS domain-containing protein [Candidatus Heimdallarchaeota archaeon]
MAFFLVGYPLVYRPKSRLNNYFIAMVGASIFWCVGYTFEIFASDEATMMFWNYIQYIGILTLPPFLLLFILVFTRHYEISKKPLLALLFFPPLVHYLFVLTNDFHNLFYASVDINPWSIISGSSLALDYTYLFYSNVVYSYILIIIGFLLLIQTYTRTASSEGNILFKKQLLIMIIAMIPPISGNIIRVFNLIPPIEFLDLTPILFVVCYILFAYAIFETSFLDIVPIARQQVVEEILDAFVVIDQDWRLVDLNTAAHNILLPELDLSSMYGKNIVELLKEEQEAYQAKIDEVHQGLEEMKRGKMTMFSTELEVIAPRQPVQKRYFDLLATPLKSPNEKDFLGCVVILRDVTDRVTAKLTLEQKNKMQEIFLKLLSHDLYNHLNVLKGYTEVATNADDLDGTREGLFAIQVKSKALLHLIEEVTSYLKIDDNLRSQPFENYDLKDGIQVVINQIQPEIDKKQISLELNFPTDPVFILANLAMNSVILNLLTNAIKFSPKNGIIKIHLIDKSTHWQLSVTDKGPGIPDDLKEKVFEPFAAYGEKKGTGLGLTIARETIQFFLGRMWIEDADPEGTTFFCEIPKNTD